jgi:predicted nucleotidyltransferase
MKLASPFTTLTEEALGEIVRRLVTALSPRAIYLFGSQLYGVPHRDSDIDIMVIIDDEPVDIEHHKKGYDALRGSGLPVELHICSTKRFQTWGTVIGTLQREIQQKGKLVYAA